MLNEVPCLHGTERRSYTKKIQHIGVCFTLDVSIDVDHKAKPDSAVYSLVDGKCILIRGREFFQVFFVV